MRGESSPTSLGERREYGKFLDIIDQGARSEMEIERARADLVQAAYLYLIDQPGVSFADFFHVRGKALGHLKTPEAAEEFLAKHGDEQRAVWKHVTEKVRALAALEGRPGVKLPFSIPESISPEDKTRWGLLLNFILHDRAHLGEGEIVYHMMDTTYAYKYIAGAKAEASGDGDEKSKPKAERTEPPLPEDFIAFYRKIIEEEFLDLYEQVQYPLQVAEALAALERGKTPERVEPIDLPNLMHSIARGIQLRVSNLDFELTTANSKQDGKNQIIVDAETTDLETNPGMLWSVIYNVVKNGMKALMAEVYKEKKDQTNQADHPLERRLRGLEPLSQPQKLNLVVQKLDSGHGDFTVIHISDTGAGLKLDDILEGVKDLVAKNLLTSAKLRKTAKEVVEQWGENPYGLRRLNVGDVMDLAGVARASGFAGKANLRDMSSGMGLWGVQYLIDKMGGSILYTNTLKEGALFTIILPNHYFKADKKGRRESRQEVAALRRGAVTGAVDLKVPKAA
ncbi:MAG: ATP-binding protein [Candidatus Magasanikbacteria bacterium]|nr:ATP-binding protein [Candidatus Magasanikbacteria bacterium]